MAAIITAGVYQGFTLPEMEEELARYKEAVKACASDIGSVSTGGDSYTYVQRRDMNLQQWGEEIKRGFMMLGDTRFGTEGGTAHSVFRIY